MQVIAKTNQQHEKKKTTHSQNRIENFSGSIEQSWTMKTNNEKKIKNKIELYARM